MSSLKTFAAAIISAAFFGTSGAAGSDYFDNQFWSHVEARGTMLLNARASFGPSPQQFTLPSAAPNTNRRYDDGYVNMAGYHGLTRDWGYNNSSQFSHNSMFFHSLESTSLGDATDAGKPRAGAELMFRQDMRKWKAVSLGLLASVGWTEMDFRNSEDAIGESVLITDIYSCSAQPPPAPYRGNPHGLGPFLSDPPFRDTTVETTSASLSEKLHTDLFITRLGPYATIPILPHLSLTLEGGLGLGLARSDYSWRENVNSFTSTLSLRSEGHSESARFHWGGFAGAELAYRFAPQWHVSLGAEWLDLGRSKASAGSRSAELRLSNLLMITAGIGFSF